MTLRDQIADDVQTVFLSEDDFAETIAYTPVGGSAREIKVVVLRKSSPIKNEANHLVYEGMVDVFVARSETTGVGQPRRGDSIRWQGQTFSFIEIVTEDVGGFMLRFSSPQVLNVGPQSRFKL